MSPKRIQRKRTKGWRMPAGAVYVGRPGKWGNPFKVGDPDWVGHWRATDPAHAVALFREFLTAGGLIDPWLIRDLHELAGRDLACWCPLDQPCHADVLLELANTTASAWAAGRDSADRHL